MKKEEPKKPARKKKTEYVSAQELTDYIVTLVPTPDEDEFPQFKMMALNVVLDIMNWVKKNAA